MKERRASKLIVEPPSVATGDIAFNLVVFFLVCASTQPDSGRKQDIPKSESKVEKSQQSENIEVALTRDRVRLNGDPVAQKDFVRRLKEKLRPKTRQEDRIVVVKSGKDTPYDFWIQVTGMIEEAGGIITLQLEEERSVTVP
ncbi:MAG: ExbD/TolR family protein [Pirellulales bacterium]